MAERRPKRLEELFQAVLIRWGLPLPKTNVRVEGFEVDCVWPDRRLEAAGWRVVRITWRQLLETPDEVEADLRKLLYG